MKTIFTLIALTVSITANAQLNENAKFIREHALDMYDAIKCTAVKKWPGDNRMIIYHINKQSDACLVSARLKKEVSNEFYIKIQKKWWDSECVTADYTMVVYEIKKQLKNSDY